MKNSIIQQIKKHLTQSHDLNEIAWGACQVLTEIKPQMPFIVFQYQRHAQPLAFFFCHKIQIEPTEAVHSLEPIYQKLSLSFTQLHIPEKLDSVSSFILIFPAEYLRDEHLIQLVNDWRSLHEIVATFAKHLLAEQNVEYGNQISQLIHDIEALIQLWKDPEQEPEKIAKRLKYQQNLNQRLLFFVRDLEILKSRIKVKELIDATLSEGGFEALKRNLVYNEIDDAIEIEVDLELFNMAVKEVLSNALKAADNDFGKIKMQVSKSVVNLHFFLKEWLIVTIINKGAEINPDFLPWIKTPYFTTWKEEGHTGFGLSISQKILEAHQGFLDVQTARDGKTEVSLYWPVK